jgi:hypothetical protein
MSEKQLWKLVLREWDVSFGTVIVRIIMLAFWVSVVLGCLRLCSWADEGSRNLPVTTPAGVHGKL